MRGCRGFFLSPSLHPGPSIHLLTNKIQKRHIDNGQRDNTIMSSSSSRPKKKISTSCTRQSTPLTTSSSSTSLASHNSAPIATSNSKLLDEFRDGFSDSDGGNGMEITAVKAAPPAKLDKRAKLRGSSRSATLNLDDFLTAGSGAFTKRRKTNKGSKKLANGRSAEESSSTASGDDLDASEDLDDEAAAASWVDKYAPKISKNVALHSSKMKDVRAAVEDVMSPDSETRILLFTGPAGTSKATILKTMFSDVFAAQQQQRRRPRTTGPEFIDWSNQESYVPRSAVKMLREFLNGAKYVGDNQDTLLIMKDLPNLMNPAVKGEFNRVLMEWLHDYHDDGTHRDTISNKRRPPCLAIVVTEVEVPGEADSSSRGSVSSYYNPASLIVEQLFHKDILASTHLRRVKFNKVARTLIKKVLTKIRNSEPRVFARLPKSVDLAQCIDYFSTFGDIRASIASFEFWAKSSEASSVGKKGSTASMLERMRRDRHLASFHAVGKVAYGSMNNRHGEAVEDSEIVVGAIIDDWGANGLGDQQVFENLLFENFLHLNRTLLSAARAAECLEHLSASNVLTARACGSASATRTMAEIAANVEVRGVRHAVMEATREAGGAKVDARRFAQMQGSALKKKRQEADVVALGQRLEALQVDYVEKTGTMVGVDSLITYETYYRDMIKSNNARLRVGSATFESMLSDGDDDMFSEEEETSGADPPATSLPLKNVQDPGRRGVNPPANAATANPHRTMPVFDDFDSFDEDFDDEAETILRNHMTLSQAPSR